MNIDLLLRAVHFVETNSDHDYCSSEFCNSLRNQKKQLKEKSSRRRGYHNELERKRRADLRDNLELLKDSVPACSDQRRISTVKLLNEASSFIESLKERSNRLELEIEKLKLELLSKQRSITRFENDVYSAFSMNENERNG
ncbi:BHLH domain-containing protein [Trichonephila clavipes]|nr:BHLH domain-containing protein [Trichonephila clavipes]